MSDAKIFHNISSIAYPIANHIPPIISEILTHKILIDINNTKIRLVAPMILRTMVAVLMVDGSFGC
jgi:hypothetical protein